MQRPFLLAIFRFSEMDGCDPVSFSVQMEERVCYK